MSLALCLLGEAQKEQMAFSNLGNAGFIISSTEKLLHEIHDLALAIKRFREELFAHSCKIKLLKKQGFCIAGCLRVEMCHLLYF